MREGQYERPKRYEIDPPYISSKDKGYIIQGSSRVLYTITNGKTITYTISD